MLPQFWELPETVRLNINKGWELGNFVCLQTLRSTTNADAKVSLVSTLRSSPLPNKISNFPHSPKFLYFSDVPTSAKFRPFEH